ncbi:hypothetical protein [Streptomyces sp. NPDC059708]|uniref:hypothetical protein n=1 Tax=Streptomyces sp. NPDC059708 TaxID=3346916 RepID=UPI0036C15D63
MDEQLMISFAKDDAEWEQLASVANAEGDVATLWQHASGAGAISWEYASELHWDQWIPYGDPEAMLRVFGTTVRRYKGGQ